MVLIATNLPGHPAKLPPPLKRRGIFFVNFSLDYNFSHADITQGNLSITLGDHKMARYLAIVLLLAGCRTYQTFDAPKAKWGLESGLATSVYPNAPCDKHEYLVEKIDLSIKIRRDW